MGCRDLPGEGPHHERLQREALTQTSSTWQTGDPPKAGYYLAAWGLPGDLHVSELWFGPNAIPKWWFSRGYAGQSMGGPCSNVLYWMPLPSPPSCETQTTPGD